MNDDLKELFFSIDIFKQTINKMYAMAEYCKTQ